MALPSLASATLLVYEGFNYSLSNGATMHGVSTNATGLTGNYSVLNSVSASGNASSTYLTSGLTFGPNFLSTSGGAVRQSAFTSTNNVGSYSFLGAALNTGNVTGIVWSSFLVSVSTLATVANGSSVARLNTAATGDSTNAYFITTPEASSASFKPGVGYDGGINAYAGATNVLAGTTYLALSQFTNVGSALSAGTPGVATLYMFDQSSYDSWLGAGGDEAALGSFAIFSATDTVTTRSFVFDNSRFIQFTDVSGSGISVSTTQTTIYDELRFGTTLADVTTVPEPGAMFLLIASGAGLAFYRGAFRRRGAARSGRESSEDLPGNPPRYAAHHARCGE
jgi:hypothetical protein